jgi:hypothetical protein
MDQKSIEQRKAAAKLTLVYLHNHLTDAINKLADAMESSDTEEEQKVFTVYAKALFDYQEVIKGWHDSMDDQFIKAMQILSVTKH